MSDNELDKKKVELWMQIKGTLGIVNIYDHGLCQDLFSQLWDNEIAPMKTELEALKSTNAKLVECVKEFLAVIDDSSYDVIDLDNFDKEVEIARQLLAEIEGSGK